MIARKLEVIRYHFLPISLNQHLVNSYYVLSSAIVIDLIQPQNFKGIENWASTWIKVF